MVSTSTLYARVLSSRPGPDMGMFGVKICISRDSDDHDNVGPVSFNWGCKRTKCIYNI